MNKRECVTIMAAWINEQMTDNSAFAQQDTHTQEWVVVVLGDDAITTVWPASTSLLNVNSWFAYKPNRTLITFIEKIGFKIISKGSDYLSFEI